MRKGARRISEIKAEILDQLNSGSIESKNLVECLAIDFNKLAKSNNIKTKPYFEKSIIKRMKYFAQYIDDWQKFQHHKSDVIRGWCAFNICQQQQFDFRQKLKYILEFAQDQHFCVREWAWLALRDDIIDNLDQALDEFAKLSKNNSPYVRRFVSEALRPRGVWCRHIVELKINPELAVTIIENLHQDSNKYVQNSVGNWLNDSTKDNPKWVIQLCQKWQKNELLTKHTQFVITRALRNTKHYL